MESKDIKTTLKEAKHALDKKDFESALTCCKAVLEADPKNYTAYIFFGVAAQELNEPSRAVDAFKQAITISPTQKLAWQGLAAFYEKTNSEEQKRALVDVYPKLIDFAIEGNDEKKLFDLYGKFSQLLLHVGNIEKCLDTLKLQMEISDTPHMKSQVHAAILQVCTDDNVAIHNLQTTLERSLQEYFTSDHAVAEIKKNVLSLYVKLLCKKQDYEKAVSEVNEIYRNFSDNDEVLEIVGQCYLDIAYRNGYNLKLDDSENVLEKLKDAKPNSHLVRMMSLLMYYHVQDLEKIIEFFSNDIDVCTPFECDLCAKCCLLVHRYSKVIQYSLKGLKLCKVKSEAALVPSLQRSLKLNELIGRFFIATKEEALNDALMLEKILDEAEVDKNIFIWLFRNYLKSGDTELAGKSLEKFGELLQIPERLGYNGVLLKMEGKLKESKLYLSDSVNEESKNIYLVLELALVLRELEEFNESFSCIVQGLRLDSYNPELYFEMGQHFLLIQEIEKAKNCFRNAFAVFPESEKIGIALSDVYQQLNDEESNVNLLTTVTNRTDGFSSKWAWLKLGLHHLKYRKAKSAIKALQTALGIDPLDSHCWESLAEAYENQGSYNSALKAYSRALELNPESVYCAFQLATLKQLLEDYAASAVDYQHLLAKDPNYVPALKGYGEVLFLQAQQNLQQYFHGLARDFCEKAIDVLTKAVLLRPDLVCFWKLLGDVCSLMYYLPSEICSSNVPYMFLKASEMGVSSLKKLDLLRLGSKCYGRAVRLMPSCASLWHDLGVNYYLISKTLNRENEEIGKSLLSLKKSVRLDPKNTLHWNSLGVIAVEMKNYPLAQHCFIKAIENDQLNAKAWTNLGVLYLMHGTKDESVLQLAYQAFSEAQSVDPSYLNSWIGQATIAELVKDADAMDLFRHSANIGNHDESAIGYADWVINTLLLSENPEDDHYKYWVENMAAIPVACDCMTKFTDCNRTNAQGLNMYGLLLEKEGMNRSAVKAFETSLNVLENLGGSDSEVDVVRCNYARILLTTGNYTESRKHFMKIKTPNLASQCGLALTCYKKQLWDESMEAYDAAFDWLAKTDEEKSHLLVAMAMVSYRQNDIKKAKTLLLESSQMKLPSIHGLLALCALGIVHYETERDLAEAALEEILLYQKEFKYCALVTFLKSAMFCAQGKLSLATGAICKAIYEQPANHVLRSFLSHHLMLYQMKTHAISNCALMADKLSRDTTAKFGADHSEIDGECLIALSSAMAGNISASWRSAQKAVHLNPGGLIGWCCLMISATADVESKAANCRKLDKEWLQRLAVFIELQIHSSVTMNKRDLLLWLLKNKILISIQMKDWNSAVLSVQELQDKRSTSDHGRNILESLTNHIQKQDFTRSRETLLQLEH